MQVVHGFATTLLDDSESDENDTSETSYIVRRSVVPHHGVCHGGTLPPPLRTALIPVCIAALFCFCATAAPLTGQALGGVPMDTPVGGANSVVTAAAVDSALPPATSSIEGRDLGVLSPDAIPPRRQGRDRARQGIWCPIYLPAASASGGCTSVAGLLSGATTDEEDEASIDDLDIDNSSISSTHDVTAAQQLAFGYNNASCWHRCTTTC
ncbi:hypothetical protein CYMTET_31261 [Cymbomonas tetramitiformis]|uniref:Uncharacterized protein n=1 Tax=Cymbomonas tetramitiformis TaxID=36881 RepID=A0AAE0FHX2_9CHLO|nr:hypothetical protein CYMTET_31261 [Cymbomonas tetramitiformis]